MLTASPQIHAPADEPVDQSVLENRAQSVGHLFRDRVTATPDRAAFLYAVVRPSRRRVAHGHLGRARRRRPGDRRRPRGPRRRGRGPRRDRLEHALRVGAGRPRDHGERRGHDDDLPHDDRRRRRLHPRRLRHARSSSPRTPSSSTSSAPSAPRSPAVSRVVVFDGRVRRRRLDAQPRRRAPAGPRVPRGRPRRHRRPHRPASGPTSSRRSSTPRARPAGPRACGCGTAPGPTRPPPSSRSTSSPRTTCSTSGCRSRTSSARCCSRCRCRSASPPRSTGASTRSSTTSPWSGRPSWGRRRASSRRPTAGSRR